MINKILNILKHKKILSLLIVSLMVVPAGAILSSNFDHPDKTGGGTTVSLYRNVNSILRNSTLSRERLSYNPNRMHTHILKNSVESSTVSNQVFQFDNITGQYQSALNGPVGTFDMAANNESVAILLYTNSGNSANLTICYKNGTTMNYDFNSLLNLSVVERLYSLETGYILEGYSKSKYLWFTVSSSGVSIVNFTGLNQSNIFITGTSGSDIFIDYSPNISFSLNNSNPHNYFLEYSDNGSLIDNFTENLNIPLNLSVCYAIQNGSNIFLTGYYSYIDAGQVSFDFAIGKIDISTGTFSFVQKWKGTSDSLTDPQNLYIVSKTWVVGNNLYIFGGLDYFYVHNGTIRIKSCGGNLSTFSMINGSFHFENLSFPSDSIIFSNVAVIGDTAFVTLNKCNYSETDDNISYDYFSNYYYLLNQTQTGLTLDNVTSYFGQYATMVCATTFNGSIYLGSSYVNGCCGPSSHLLISLDPSTMQYRVLPISSTISICESAPLYWTSTSSYGDNGVLTVGGDGFDFYNSTGFHSVGDIGTNGFLLGSAWNGNMFMLVGQKYFQSFYPTEGVIAYIYFPQNNTLKDITGLFSPSLSENATLVSVSAVGDNFIIAGIDNAMSTKQDILFIYNSSSGTLTNITNSLPSISDVCRVDTTSSGTYAFVSFVTGIAGSSGESIYLGYYHDNSFIYVSSFVNAEFNPFNSAFASWYSPFMYANGSMLYMFGTSKTNTCYFLEYAYNAANGTITGGNVAYDLSGAKIQYVTGFNGNVLLLAPNVAYGFNTTDSIMSAQMDLPSISFGNIFSAVQYGNSIFMSGGQNPNVYYGILSFSFSSFGTGKYTVHFNESGLQYYIPYNEWYLSVSSLNSNYVYTYYSTNNSIAADLPFGTYTYYAALVNGTEYLNGSFVLNTTTVSYSNLSLNFPTVYKLTFMETGLGLSGTWGIKFDGQLPKDFTTQAGDSINIYASGYNSYAYFFNSHGNCIINTSYVQLIVSGNITSTIHIPATYEVTLEASNFTLGESWYALISNTYFASYVVNSSSYSSFDIGSSESSMSIYLPNGSYFVEYGVDSYSRTFNDTFSVNGSSITIVLSLPSLYILQIFWSNQPSSSTGFSGFILFVNGIEYSQYSANVNETSLDLADGTYLISSTMTFGIQNGVGQGGSINGPQFYVNITGSNKNVSVSWYTLFDVKFLTNLNVIPEKAVVNVSLQGVHGVSLVTAGPNLTSLNLYLPNGTYQPVLQGVFNNTSTLGESLLKVAGKNLSDRFYLYSGLLRVIPSGAHLTLAEIHNFYNQTSFSFDISTNVSSLSVSGYSVSLYLSNNTYNVNFNAIYEGTTSISKNSYLNVSGKTFSLSYSIPYPFYAVNVKEIGLPSYMGWSFSISGQTGSSLIVTESVSSYSSGATLYLPAGNYSYSSSPITEYQSITQSGTFTLVNSSVNVTVYFSINVTLYVYENGLPSGTTWYFTIKGATYNISGLPITFEINTTDTYNFTVDSPSGYLASPESGSINILDFENMTNISSSFYLRINFNKASTTDLGNILSTIQLPSFTTQSGSYLSMPGKEEPIMEVFDPYNNLFYIGYEILNSNGPLAGIDVLYASNGTLYQNIRLGYNTFVGAMVYDTYNHFIYAEIQNTSTESYQILQLDPNLSPVGLVYSGIIGSGYEPPFALTYAPVSNKLYISNQTNIFEINATTLKLNATIYLGSNENSVSLPEILFSSVTNDLYVTGFSNDLLVINPITFAVVGNYTINGNPSGLLDGPYHLYYTGGLTFNRNNGNLYLEANLINSTNSSSSLQSFVYILSGTNGSLLKYVRIPGGQGYTLLFDNVTNTIWGTQAVTSFNDNNSLNNYLGEIFEINVTTDSVIANYTTGLFTFSMALDNLTGSLLIANVLSSSLTIIDTKPAAIKTYEVNIHETGLPAGELWYVDISNGQKYYSTTSNLIINETNGTYELTIFTASPYYIPHYNQNLTINGLAQTVNVTFVYSAFNVTVTESGLPAGTEWYMNISNGLQLQSNLSSISFLIKNGTYSFEIAAHGFIANISSGTFTINGSRYNFSVSFTQLKYNLTFDETGLPSGTVWYVNITGYISGPISGVSYSFNVPDGTYLFTISTADKNYAPSVVSKLVTVDGYNVTITIVFSLLTYEVTFNEIGLPNGTPWYVNISGGNLPSYQNQTIDTLSYNISLSNGSYSFIVGTLDPVYKSELSSGTFQVNGTRLYEDVQFKQVEFLVNFSANNLPSGIEWYVNITGYLNSGPISSGYYLTFLPNGTYSFTISSSNKSYVPIPASGSFVINGSGLSELINFSVYTSKVTFQETGLRTGLSWYINLSNGMTSGVITGSSYSFSLINGTYSYKIVSTNKTYAPNVTSGSFTVKGMPVTIDIEFLQVTYRVTFNETGLPSGTIWYVNLSNGMDSGQITGDTYSINLTNGTYYFVLSTSDKDYAPSYNNSFRVNGSNISIRVVFVPVTFAVTFNSNNLPSGNTWYVNITGETGSGPITSSSYTFYLQNGSYSFYVASTNKVYAPSYVSTFTVDGSQLIINITFTEVKYNLTIEESGLPTNTEWNLTFEGTTYQLTNTSYVFSVPNGTYSFFAASHDYKDVSGTITVSGFSFTYTINMELQLYPITFNETGLQSGMFWYVNITESNGSKYLSGPIGSGSIYTINLTNGTYVYSISTSNRIFAPVSAQNSLIVNGSSLNIEIKIVEVTYSIEFEETGLPSGIIWYVNITESNGTTYLSGQISGSSYSFSLTNGSYTYKISSANKIYAPNLTSGTFTVNGLPFSESITFTEVLYTLQFTETGLPSSASWYVNITESNGTTYLSGQISGSSYSFSLTNGSYTYKIASSNKIYAPNLTSGTFTVNGYTLSISITFSEVLYTVQFTETGLPSGASWYVNITESNGTTYLSGPISGSSYSFSLTNGSYTYTIASANKIYVPSLISAAFTVDGLSFSIPTTFTLLRYDVTIQESGLPTNTEWNLTFNGITYQLTNTSYIFQLPNGTYSYQIQAEPGYTVSSGIFTVSGKPLTVNVVFIKNATVFVKVSPSSASFYINGIEHKLSSGSLTLSLTPGSYFVNASESGYYSYTNLFTFGSSVYYINISLVKLVNYGYLTGSVSPDTALISANGILITVSNGSFNQTLSPGEYIVSVSASGYVSKTYEVNITVNSVTQLTITLTRAIVTYTVTGHISPYDASIMFGEYSAYVNSTGYYEISLPSGSYKISVTAIGYYSISENLNITSNMELNFTLVPLPPVTSQQTTSNTSAQGYNVTVSNLSVGDGNISVTYNSTPNGTIVVILPYSEVRNATVSQLLNSTVYVNGVKYTNFTIALSTINGTFDAILTVYGLNGDPVLIWAYSPSFKIPVHPVSPAVSNNNYLLYIVIGIAVAAVIAVGVILVRRRR